MGTISLRNVGITAGESLFKGIDLVLGDGERIGLVAGNGRGKTTFLNCIAGRREPSAGAITLSRGLRIGFMEQDLPSALDRLTLREAVLSGLPVEERESGAWRADVALDAFSAPEDLREREVQALSGGWQRLMLIARAAVAEPDALLLDEPTNHLDLEKLAVLERWVKHDVQGLPMIIASHDRAFLDAVTNRTLFLRPGLSRVFSLPFSRARAALADEDAAAADQQLRDLKEAGKLRKQAAKLTNIGINSGSDLLVKKSKLLRDRAGRIEDSQTMLHKERSGLIRLASGNSPARVLLAIENAVVATPADEPLFRIDKLHVFNGDRIVLLGRNGAGKSQLMKAIKRAIEQPDRAPGFRVTQSLALGHTDQDMAQMPAASTPWDLVSAFDIGDQKSRTVLAAAGLVPEKQRRPVGELSLGQRARLGLLLLRLRVPNFYLLDEPTNHVDIAGQEALESEILEHGATCILVSHDRQFVRNVGTRFLVIGRKRLVESEGPEDFFAEMAAGA